MAEAKEPNPFAGLLPTPENLAAQRSYDFESQTEGQDFWARSAGRAGLSVRKYLVGRGIALSPEDERAISTQKITQGAQKRLAELVKSGELDPMDAQEMVINETMGAFMQAGDYQAAQSLIPALNKIRTYKDEQAKLRSETYENVAQGDKAVAETGRVPYLIESDQAQTRQREAAAGASDALTRLRDRTDPNIRSGSGTTHKVGTAEQAEDRAAIGGTLNLFSRLDELSLFMKHVPGAASFGGAAANTGGQFLAGAHSFLSGKGSVSSGDIANLTPSQQAIVERAMSANRTARARQAMSLGMAVTAYDSLVVETAYALARVNDPGGRLSNNDFDYALRQLGAVQDARSAQAAFAAIAERAHDNIKSRMTALGKSTAEELYGEGLAAIEEQYAKFKAAWGGSTVREVDKKSTPSGSVADDRPADIQEIIDRHKQGK